MSHPVLQIDRLEQAPGIPRCASASTPSKSGRIVSVVDALQAYIVSLNVELELSERPGA